MVAAYFEDPRARPTLMALAVRKGLWGYMQKYIAALHAHAGGAGCGAPDRDSSPVRHLHNLPQHCALTHGASPVLRQMSRTGMMCLMCGGRAAGMQPTMANLRLL
jgi:hypothetical protein